MSTIKSAVPPPSPRRGDQLTIQKVSDPFGCPDSPIRGKIVEAINRMGGVGEDAEVRYQAALRGLRKQSREIAPAVAALYEALPVNRYLDRWSLVQLVVSLKDRASLSFLNEIITSPIPAEPKNRAAHPCIKVSAVGNEVIIRTTAIEAVERLAAIGDKGALKVLFEHTQHSNFSVKRAAIQGFLAVGGKQARQKLLKTLPKKDHYILDIHRRDVREVPQPKSQTRFGHEPKLPPRATFGKSSNRH